MTKSNHFVLGFVLGTASALVTTYLLAPKSTDELKRRLKDSGSQLGDRATDYYEYAKDATSDLRSSAEELVTGLKTKLHKDEDIDLDTYDEETAELRGAVTDSSDDAEDDDADFDDIVVDGKSAFAQAKDEATPTAEDAEPAPAAEPSPAAEYEPSADAAAAEDAK